jgi:phosphoribosylformylglycinamidine cyclo-ligase
VRHVLLDRAGWSLDRQVPELGRHLGDELLEPTRIYARDCLALIDAVEVHAFSHVTGGGLANNLARVLPADLTATIDRATWTPAAVFDLVGAVGRVAREDLEATLNMGVGMVAVVAAGDADRAVRLLAEREVPAWVAGTVRQAPDASSSGRVTLIGDHA